MHKCVCGKEFTSNNRLNGHKSGCKQYLGEARYIEVYQNRLKSRINSSHLTNKQKQEIKKQKEQEWIKEKHICKTCGQIMTHYYASGRFCNRNCANRFPRNHIKKVYEYKNDLKIPCPHCDRTFPNKGGLASHIIWKHIGVENKGSRKYHYSTSHSRTHEYRIDFENITVDEMKTYRQNHNNCEICGKSVEEIKKEKNHFKGLCIDHNHENNRFRGLLCVTCNRNLGWFENNRESAINYLNKKM